MDIIELIEIYEDRIIFDCESDKTKIAVYINGNEYWLWLQDPSP